MESFLFQATIYLLAGVVTVPLAKRYGLGSVLGYLFAGIVIGPILGLVGSESEDLRHFAEFGVVMMLFIVGLQLEPRALWDMRHRLIGLGGLQVSMTTVAVSLLCTWLGQPWTISLAIGLTFALSSTAIVLQTIDEKGLMQTNGGRSAFSVLLTQDIAVIPMLILVPLLAIPGLQNNALPHEEVAHGGGAALMSIIEGLPGWGVTLVTIGAVVSIIFGGHYLTRPIFRFISMAQLREIYTATALLLVIGIAFLMTLVGLSPALGTFLAGVVLANSEFRHELESDIQPFKGLLLGLFFITVGAGINFEVLFGNVSGIFALTFGLIAIKAAILYLLAQIFHIRGRDKILFTLGLAQAGEFGFVLLGFMVQTNVIPTDLSQSLLLVVALSMLLTPILFILHDILIRHLGDGATLQEADEIEEQGTIIVAGVGRFGQVVNRIIDMAGHSATVLDHDLDTVQSMRKFGVKGFFGDPTRPELLQAAGIKNAKILVVAVDSPDSAVKIVEQARRQRPDLHIIARARDQLHVYRLFQAGANDIVRESFDSSVRAGRYVLENIGFSHFDAQKATEHFVKSDRRSLRELALLWDPNIPVEQNEPYMERVREFGSELKTSLSFDTAVSGEGEDDHLINPRSNKATNLD
jgi:CPA2 family monovalent cation:H+ antiporter-2